jgi:uncharacterized protein (DUF2236 family)
VAAGAAAGAVARVWAPVLAGPVRRALSQLGPAPGPSPDAAADPQKGDAGWFGPDSVIWRVHGDDSMLVAGMAAFALQTLHPRAMAGVVDHGSFGTDFFGRIRRTGEFVLNTTYGTSEDADRAVRIATKMHGRVAGTTPDGRPYDANEPELLHWVHVTQYVATAAAYQRFASHPLTDDELDRYVDEASVVGRAMGVPDAPRSWAEADDALQRHRRNLALMEQSSRALSFLARPPMLPSAAGPVWDVVWAGGLACLPPFARKLIMAPEPTSLQVGACRALVRALGALVGEPRMIAAARRRIALP